MKNAFTMIELVFVIVIIGILAVVAVPKLTPIVGSAKTAKAIATLASVRSAIATERQKRILSSDFTSISDLGDSTYVFKNFDSASPVLEYPMKSCTNGGCWQRVNATSYKYHFSSSSTADFKLDHNRLICDDDTADCEKLTH